MWRDVKAERVVIVRIQACEGGELKNYPWLSAKSTTERGGEVHVFPQGQLTLLESNSNASSCTRLAWADYPREEGLPACSYDLENDRLQMLALGKQALYF